MYDFFDRDHANNYLAGTIVRHKKTPTVVHSVDYAARGQRKYIVSHVPLREDDLRHDKMEEFDFRPVRLGMYNFSVRGEIVEAAWMQRYPARRWKVGLDRGGICVIPIRKAEDNMIFEVLKAGRSWDGQPWAKNRDMADCLEGKYPSLLEGLDRLGKRTRCSFAFSPNFAVTGNLKLYYRHSDQPVGKIEGGAPVLFQDYLDLREILQEDLR